MVASFERLTKSSPRKIRLAGIPYRTYDMICESEIDFFFFLMGRKRRIIIVNFQLEFYLRGKDGGNGTVLLLCYLRPQNYCTSRGKGHGE